jgi:glutathione reductase (NADPH)
MEKEKLLGLTVQQKQPDKVFNHVMLAIGRSAYTKNLGLEEVGVKCAKSGKIICQDYDRTSVENIFAMGCCRRKIRVDSICSQSWKTTCS